jgi:hypothetical protein
MDPASITILLLLIVLALVGGVFFFFTAAGLELREGRRERRRQRRPTHVRVENEEHVRSSPVRDEPASSGETQGMPADD